MIVSSSSEREADFESAICSFSRPRKRSKAPAVRFWNGWSWRLHPPPPPPPRAGGGGGPAPLPQPLHLLRHERRFVLLVVGLVDDDGAAGAVLRPEVLLLALL